MPSSIQTNKEFVETAGIAEQDAFIAVTIRRIVARMTEIPARELVANKNFSDLLLGAGFYTDWDEQAFLVELEEALNVDIDLDQADKNISTVIDHYHWFYLPGMTFGEWVRFVIDQILSPVREEISVPSDWTGLENSDSAMDEISQKSPAHDSLLWMTRAIVVLASLICLTMISARIAGCS